MSGWNQRRNPNNIHHHNIHLHSLHPHSAVQNFRFHPSNNLSFHHCQKLWLGGSHHPHRLISNYLPHCRSGQKWQFLLATTSFMTQVAKNGNKQNDLQLYRELKSLFCHFWQYFAFSSFIMLSKNCQKWQFLLTS